jgi:FMN phosphatase YigB (HAD superfamily)
VPADATSAGGGALPLLTLDFDGVICAPLLGRNIGIHRAFLDPAAAPPPARVWPRWLGGPLDHLRFDLRRPLPEARAALEALAGVRRLVVLTGRRSSPAPWLRRHGLPDVFERIVVNDSPLRSPHFKRRAVEALGAAAHVDDDPRTVQLLAETTGVDVFLRDWPRNRDLPFHPRVARVADLADLARRLAGGA